MRAAVLGSPVAHSLSPALHRAAWASLGLTGTYDRVELVSGQLEGFLGGLDDEWVGLSLTMPLKQAVLPLLDEVSELAALTGAANTVVLSGGRRSGHNTDVEGIVRALGRPLEDVTVLGAGATAASALAAAAQLGAPRAEVLARSPARAEVLRPLAEALGLDLVVATWRQPRASVVVSTAPAGALDDLAGLLATDALLLDVVYDPWPTALAAAFAAAGGTIVAGTEMLLHQAVAQVVLMTGREPSVAAMRAALP